MSWHEWEFEPRKLPWRKDDPKAENIDGFTCKICGYWHRMKYPMPKSTLEHFKVPTCEEYVIKVVHIS